MKNKTDKLKKKVKKLTKYNDVIISSILTKEEREAYEKMKMRGDDNEKR